MESKVICNAASSCAKLRLESRWQLRENWSSTSTSATLPRGVDFQWSYSPRLARSKHSPNFSFICTSTLCFLDLIRIIISQLRFLIHYSTFTNFADNDNDGRMSIETLDIQSVCFDTLFTMQRYCLKNERDPLSSPRCRQLLRRKTRTALEIYWWRDRRPWTKSGARPRGLRRQQWRILPKLSTHGDCYFAAA